MLLLPLLLLPLLLDGCLKDESGISLSDSGTRDTDAIPNLTPDKKSEEEILLYLSHDLHSSSHSLRPHAFRAHTCSKCSRLARPFDHG